MITDEVRETAQQIISILFDDAWGESLLHALGPGENSELQQILEDSAAVTDAESEIDEYFRTDEKDNIFYNIGHLFAVQLPKTEELNAWGEIIDQLDEYLSCEGLRSGYLDGLDYGILDWEESGDEWKVTAAMVLRAVCSKYCTDNINSLLEPSNG